MKKQTLENLFEKKKQINLIIIDALNLVHRYDWSYRNLRDSKNRETGLFYGVLNFVCGLRIKYGKEVKIIFLWDSRSRKVELDETYKANRKDKKEGFWDKIKILQYLLSFLDLEQFKAEGYEADDLAYNLMLKNKDKNILFISEDNDWIQLLVDNDKHIQMKDKIMNKEEMEEFIGMPIKHYTLFKSIVGDSSDNIHSIFKAVQTSNLKIREQVIEAVKEINGNILKINEWEKIECKEIGIIEYLYENAEKIKENYKLVMFQELRGGMDKIMKIDDNKKFLEILHDFEMNGLIKKIRNIL